MLFTVHHNPCGERCMVTERLGVWVHNSEGESDVLGDPTTHIASCNANIVCLFI